MQYINDARYLTGVTTSRAGRMRKLREDNKQILQGSYRSSPKTFFSSRPLRFQALRSITLGKRVLFCYDNSYVLQKDSRS